MKIVIHENFIRSMLNYYFSAFILPGNSLKNNNNWSRIKIIDRETDKIQHKTA